MAETLHIRRYVQLRSLPADALLLEDELRFIDLPRSPLWCGQERVVVVGSPTLV